MCCFPCFKRSRSGENNNGGESGGSLNNIVFDPEEEGNANLRESLLPSTT